MNIQPIKTKKNYEKSLNRIDKLWESKKNTPEGDELEILSILVEEYEKRHYPILPPDPIEAIKFRMEQMGLKPSDIAPFLGGKNRVSEVLHRKRKLTVGMMKSLHKNLDIPAESLLAEI